MRAICLIAACALLTGCGTVRPVQVSVPLPVACSEQIAPRPIMPTEQLEPGVEPWVLLRAALAEIDRREGFEVQLVAALRACTAQEPLTITTRHHLWLIARLWGSNDAQ